jgi:vacuolar-type H+-ATPase subunit F/Vma7
MATITFLTPDDAYPGFELAGLNQLSCPPEQTTMLLDEYIAENREGILAIDERLLESVTHEYLRKIERRWNGIFVIIPAPKEPVEGAEDYALELVRRAIGYHVRMTP